MKIEAKDVNYAATVVGIQRLVPLDNCDNIVGFPTMGMQAIVGKESSYEGEVGILFPTEVQLSDRFCYENNLYRHSNLNKDISQKGYVEDNRRVRAIKLRGHTSNALFMPLSSLRYLGVNDVQLKIGDVFDTLNGETVCEKYYVKPPRETSGGGNTVRVGKARVNVRAFPEQFPVTHFLRVDRNIDDDELCVVTQKLHGTSIRVGNVQVDKPLGWKERIAKFLGVKVQTTEYDYVYGSHHVIKDVNNPAQQHFYGDDIWTREGKKLNGLLPENYIVYGELVGYVNQGKPIQSHYTYGQAVGTCKFYAYRVAVVNAQGISVDLSWNAVKEFCDSIGIDHVRELWRGRVGDLNVEEFLNKNFYETDGKAGEWWPSPYREIPVKLSNDSPVDEGICVRIDSGMTPEIYKAKSSVFLEHESRELDSGEPDIESTESDSVSST